MKRLEIIKVKGDNVCVIIIFILSHSDHPNPAEFACSFQNCKIHHTLYDPQEITNAERGCPCHVKTVSCTTFPR